MTANNTSLGEEQAKKTCPHCKTHPVEKGSYCNDCGRILTIKRQQKFKTACVSHICKEQNTEYGTCSECGEVFQDAQLCIRHREQRPDNVKISKLTGSVPLKDRVVRELDKCDLLCHNCERKLYRSKRPPTKLKQKALEFLGGKCAHCDCAGPPSALEFHHVDPTKKTLQLGDRGLKSWSTIIEDLKVCEIICANCHSKHHAEEKLEERNRYLASVGLSLEELPGGYKGSPTAESRSSELEPSASSEPQELAQPSEPPKEPES